MRRFTILMGIHNKFSTRRKRLFLPRGRSREKFIAPSFLDGFWFPLKVDVRHVDGSLTHLSNPPSTNFPRKSKRFKIKLMNIFDRVFRIPRLLLNIWYLYINFFLFFFFCLTALIVDRIVHFSKSKSTFSNSFKISKTATTGNDTIGRRRYE